MNYGRHLPAFVLLFLEKGANYGLKLSLLMEESMPFYCMDNPAIYRTLRDLEQVEAVQSYWDTSEPGAAKKYYKITEIGCEMLRGYRDDIICRKENLDFFLSEYEQSQRTQTGKGMPDR